MGQDGTEERESLDEFEQSAQEEVRVARKRFVALQAQYNEAQETWIMPGRLALASASARGRGWQMLASAAARGEGGGASGGVAIFARLFVGLRMPPRAAACWNQAGL